MARVFGNRVRETTTSVGLGDLALGGADSGYRPFSAVCADGDVCGYAIFSQSSALWEVGEGTYHVAGNTFSRTLVTSSSNADALVNLPAGAKVIILTKIKENERRLLPPLPAFPVIAGLQLRLSAEFSAMTLNTDDRVAQINDLAGSWANFVAAGAARPRWRREAIAGLRPGIIFDGLATRMTSAAVKVLVQPCTVVAVFQHWRAAGGNQDMYRDSSGAGPVFFRNAANSWAIFAGTGLTSVALYDQNVQAERQASLDAAPAISMHTYNGVASLLSNNGVEVVGNAGATGFTGTLGIGGNGSGTFSPFILYEFLIYNSALTAPQRALLNAYYANALDIRL